MKFSTRLGAAVLVSSAAVGCGLVGTASMASAAPSRRPAYTCTGGDLASGTFTSIPSGNYSSITIKGVCNITPDAVINVVGNINVAPGATLDAQSAPSTITVGGNVNAGPGSLLGLGCQPENTIGMFAGVPCAVEPDGQTTITVDGNVTAIHADTVFLRKVTIGGNVTLIGGGGDNPWSIKGNTIARNLTISGVRPEWLGVQFNHVNGNVILIDIAIHDEDPGGVPAVVENTVGRNLICFGLKPGVSGGFIPGEVNHVTGHAIGQCASLV
jgi:hypothetical protein